MSEPPGLKYPHEKVLTGIGLLLLFPRKGETKRLFGVSPRLNLIVTIAPQTVTLDLVEPDPDGWTVVRMSADEARSVKQVQGEQDPTVPHHRVGSLEVGPLFW